MDKPEIQSSSQKSVVKTEAPKAVDSDSEQQKDEEMEEFEMKDEFGFIVLDESEADQNVEDNSKEHPYWTEIEALEPLPSQLQKTECNLPKPLTESPFLLINRTFDLIKMAKSLKNEQEIAIDLEVDRKTYDEFVTVMLITTKTTDYIIDTITLKNDLMILAEIFTNPKIVKIIANNREKIVYLQQMLHLFVVNMFDISEALVALEKPSLYNQLYDLYKVKREFKYVNFDYKTRPLPPDVISFLRSGSHYLIHYYTTLKNELIDQPDLYKSLLEKFKLKCKILYNDFNDLYYRKMLEQVKIRHKRELIVLEQMQKWRKELARKYNLNADNILNAEHLKLLVKDLTLNSNFLKNNKYIMEHVDEIYQIFNNAKELATGRKPTNANKPSVDKSPVVDNKKKKKNFPSPPPKKPFPNRTLKRFSGNTNKRFQTPITTPFSRFPNRPTNVNLMPNKNFGNDRNEGFNRNQSVGLFSRDNSNFGNSSNGCQYFDNNTDRRLNELESRLQFEAFKRSPF